MSGAQGNSNTSGCISGPQGSQGMQGSPGPTGWCGIPGPAGCTGIGFTGPSGPYPKYIPDSLSDDSKENYLIWLRYFTDKEHLMVKTQGNKDKAISVLFEKIMGSLDPMHDGRSFWGPFIFTIKNKQLSVNDYNANNRIDIDSIPLINEIIDKLQRMCSLRAFL